jgi:S1-C subfamily serine protease
MHELRPNQLLLCSLIGLIGGAGCRVQEIRSMYKKEFCSDGDVSVEAIGGERYQASGCNRSVIYQCLGNSCVPDSLADEGESASEDQASSSPNAQEPSRPTTNLAGAGGTRRQKREGGKVVLAVDIPLDRRSMLRLRAVPLQEGGPVQLKLVRIEREPELEECDLDWMINGQRLDAPKAKFHRTGLLSSLRNDVPRGIVSELGTAQQFAIRACDFRWSLNPEQLAEVRRFVGLFEEELAWQGPARKGGSGGLLAPRGGWPEWEASDDAPAPVRTGDALDAQALFKLLSPSVYQVEALLETGVSTGSAVAVSKTELLTNCHVVQGARKLVLKQQKRQLTASVARSDPATDRCVLSVADGGLTPVRGVRAYDDLAVGEQAYTLGSPAGLQLSLSNGIISGLREEAGRSYVQTTAPISPGSSGGGLFDARGNVVGITTMVLQGRERLNQSLNFAIPADSFWKP